MAYQKWMYHPKKNPKIFVISKAKDVVDLKKSGWFESPAHFGNKPTDDQDDAPFDFNELSVKFINSEDTMSQDELVFLAKELKIQGANDNWKYETLITKIDEAFEAKALEGDESDDNEGPKPLIPGLDNGNSNDE